ncbi:peptidase m28 [Bacillus sp. FJAT-27225]|uniref:M20/M25/M40 family metallo-hydrolase n=1 Tax=Bacillus sp. FJAT-27225 TaxID=1743144 RepID=UPI00080C319A|nr:M20/M25/M40 family metallo-hydrolase [Bacillus sp. FJAT-27225]OCA87698.1 peptidase m28 [Bacillus sp. FJAT-27225]
MNGGVGMEIRIGESGRPVLTFLMVVVILVSTVVVSLLQLRTPEVISTTSADGFSAERAFSYLEEFAVKPHPLGSEEHDRVRDYLVETLEGFGLKPEVQKAESVHMPKGYITGGIIENVVVRIEGKNPSKAIMLAAHYDSVPGSPGVSDDGAGVAAILETARILTEGKQLENDVILLLTDGEENGMLGAKAFVDEHQWADEVGLVLNFEARGNEGPSFMFETSDNNGWLVKEFVEAAPSPVAHSFIYSLYKLMPNDTDLSIFKNAGLNGMNFAFGEGVGHYHTTSDSLAELDKESLQHHGEYMLSLVKHFGGLDLDADREGNRLFFNLVGGLMVTYPEVLVFQLMLVAIVLYVLTIVHGHKRKLLSIKGVIGGFGVQIGVMAGAFLIGLAGWKLLTALFSDMAWLMGTDVSFGKIYLLGFSFIVFAFLGYVYARVSRRMKLGSLAMGSLLVWLLFAVVTSLFLEAGSYVFVWPLLFALVGMNGVFWFKEMAGKSLMVVAVSAVPAFLIVVPVIYLVHMLVSINLVSVLMVLVSLLGALLVPLFGSFGGASGTGKVEWRVPALLMVVGLAIVVINSVNVLSQPSAEHPKASDITYLLDADKGEAYWVARHALDEYSLSYVEGNVEKGNVSDIFPILNWPNSSYAAAKIHDIKGPEVKVVSDEVREGVRELEYEIQSVSAAEEIMIKSMTDLNVSELEVNGKKVELPIKKFTKEKPFLITYVVGQKGKLNMKISIAADDKTDWIIAARAYNIPEEKAKRANKYSTYGDNSFIMTRLKD